MLIFFLRIQMIVFVEQIKKEKENSPRYEFTLKFAKFMQMNESIRL